ncbi:MAG: hypothetical protein QMD11_09035, partial [Smithella sp.]|nr:hypothetical protein [Smithella sp.]
MAKVITTVGEKEEVLSNTDEQSGNSAKETLSPLGKYVEGMPWNPVEKVILERRSIRAFKKEPLPDSMIKR